MGTHPINLTVRFLLELVALFTLGFWGKESIDGWLGYLLAIGLPLLAAVVWGVFAVPKDPSRSGKALVPVAGAVRLMIECLIFGCAVYVLFDLDYLNYSRTLASVVLIHYLLSYDRILWLLNKR